MYGFASDYRHPHQIAWPDALDLELGANRLKAEVLVEVERDYARAAPQEVGVLGSHVVQAGF